MILVGNAALGVPQPNPNAVKRNAGGGVPYNGFMIINVKGTGG